VRRGLLVAALASAALFCAACEDGSHADIADEINILVRRNDQLVPPATERLAAYKRAAIPQIETSLHTSAPTGRLHLVAAMARIGDGEAVPILRHTALYDITPDVRAAAEAVLAGWATGNDARGVRARDAIAEIARKRAAGEGPLLFGDGGIPGAPSTVGAPDPVGSGPNP
jgi:hypothetical protein